MTAVGSDEDAEVVVEEVLLLDPVAVDEAEVAIVEAAPVEAVELASSAWSWSWSCSSSEEAEAEAKVASLSPSSQCLLLSVKRIYSHSSRILTVHRHGNGNYQKNLADSPGCIPARSLPILRCPRSRRALPRHVNDIQSLRSGLHRRHCWWTMMSVPPRMPLWLRSRRTVWNA